PSSPTPPPSLHAALPICASTSPRAIRSSASRRGSISTFAWSFGFLASCWIWGELALPPPAALTAHASTPTAINIISVGSSKPPAGDFDFVTTHPSQTHAREPPQY